MKNARITFAAIGLVGLVACSFVPPGFERYCFLYPRIDTRYAEGFSEAKFKSIRAGMTTGEVRMVLGTPLDELVSGNSIRWSYTSDGRCTWADWAWLGREVMFVDGRVSGKVAQVYYD